MDLPAIHKYQEKDSQPTNCHVFQLSKHLPKSAPSGVSLPKLKPFFINSHFVRTSPLKKNVFTFPERH